MKDFTKKIKDYLQLNIYNFQDVSILLTKNYINKSNIAQAVIDLITRYAMQDQDYLLSVTDLKKILIENLGRRGDFIRGLFNIDLSINTFIHTVPFSIATFINTIFDDSDTIENIKQVLIQNKQCSLGANGSIFIDKGSKPNFGIFDATFATLADLAKQQFAKESDILDVFQQNKIDLYSIDFDENTKNTENLKFLDRIWTAMHGLATIISITGNKIWILPDDLTIIQKNQNKTITILSTADAAFHFIHPALYVLGNWQKEFIDVMLNYSITNFNLFDDKGEMYYDYLLYHYKEEDLKELIKNRNIENLNIHPLEILTWIKNFLKQLTIVEKIQFTLNIMPDLLSTARAATNQYYKWPLITAYWFYHPKDEFQRYLRIESQTIANQIKLANASQQTTTHTLIGNNFTAYEFANFLESSFTKSIAEGFGHPETAANKQEYSVSIVCATGLFALASYLEKQSQENKLTDKTYIQKRNIFNAASQLISENSAAENLNKLLLENLKRINVPKGFYSTEFHDLIFALTMLPSQLLVAHQNAFIHSNVKIPSAVIYKKDKIILNNEDDLLRILKENNISQISYSKNFKTHEINLCLEKHDLNEYMFLQKVSINDPNYRNKDIRYIGVDKDTKQTWFIEAGQQNLFTTTLEFSATLVNNITTLVFQKPFSFKQDETKPEQIKDSLAFLLSLIPQVAQITFTNLSTNSFQFELFANKNNRSTFKEEQTAQQDTYLAKNL